MIFPSANWALFFWQDVHSPPYSGLGKKASNVWWQLLSQLDLKYCTAELTNKEGPQGYAQAFRVWRLFPYTKRHIFPIAKRVKSIIKYCITSKEYIIGHRLQTVLKEVWCGVFLQFVSATPNCQLWRKKWNNPSFLAWEFQNQLRRLNLTCGAN